MSNTIALLQKGHLGKASVYKSIYDASLLFSIPRQPKRDEIHVPSPLPFHGMDIWNAYEISWLNSKGKPMIAMAEFQIPCTSPNIIESKSLKLYLNSYNQTQFSSVEEITQYLTQDLSKATGATIQVNIILPEAFSEQHFKEPQGICLDHLDITTNTYTTCADFLMTENTIVEETVFSNLLKSNCLATGQPDWATVVISYKGKRINHENLLKYIISFREHNEFHEQCVERIYMDLLRACQPEHLAVYARYTRRGGLDINPFRANYAYNAENFRTARQ